ncbi:MAG: hypothetical protein DWQ10_05110, partial [Calditrichaeota bacterium]
MKFHFNKPNRENRHSVMLLDEIHKFSLLHFRNFPFMPKLKQSAFCILIATFAFFATAHASDEIPSKKQKHPIALTGGTVHTVSGETLVNATLLFEKGKITAIGTIMTLPDSTEKIDISGKHVYPGLISANSRVGLLEIAAVRATRDYAEVTAIKPNVRVESALNPDSELLPVTRANGITLTHTIPMGGLISGTSAMVMMDGWTWEDLTLRAPIGLYINWPNMAPFRRNSTEKQKIEFLKKRDEQITHLKNAFADARAYLKAKEAESNKKITYHESDIRWEAMMPVLNKEIPVLLEARGIKEIQASIDWALSEDLDIILMTGADVRFAIDLLKENNIPVIYKGTLALPSQRWEPYDTPFTVPRQLYNAGVRFCISGSGTAFAAAHERNLPYHAAMAVAFGLPQEEALKSVTLYPAQILGVADLVG